jgi:hypothetical protein
VATPPPVAIELSEDERALGELVAPANHRAGLGVAIEERVGRGGGPVEL